MAQQGFSGVVLMQRHGQTLLLGGWGFANCERTRPMTPDMVFDIGSITKPMTAVAVLDLVAAGRLSLSDTLGRFFPNAPPDKAGITVQQLLLHTSGMPDVLGRDEDYVDKAWIIEHGLRARLVSRPGETENYSNLGYSLLGVIIEAVSGTTYEDYLTRRVLARAGLTRTGYTLPRWSPGELACGLRDGRRYGASRDYFGPDGPSWHLRANGGIHSTATELARWFDALQSGTLLPPEQTALLIQSLTHTSGSTRYVSHGGSNIIFTADYFRFLASDVTMVFFSSDSRWPKDIVMRQLLRYLQPIYAPRPPR